MFQLQIVFESADVEGTGLVDLDELKSIMIPLFEMKRVSDITDSDISDLHAALANSKGLVPYAKLLSSVQVVNKKAGKQALHVKM
jgi:hypothetical protein